MITRHNRVRNLISHFADVGLLSPELEKMGILGPKAGLPIEGSRSMLQLFVLLLPLI